MERLNLPHREKTVTNFYDHNVHWIILHSRPSKRQLQSARKVLKPAGYKPIDKDNMWWFKKEAKA